MKLEGVGAVVTGGGSGIGAALVRRLDAAGAAKVVVADIDGEAAEAVAAEVDGIGVRVDVGREQEIGALVERAGAELGQIDLFCSNAGVPGPYGGPEISDAEWQRTWEINVMAHIWAARALLPKMLDRGSGHISSTASAAGLLANPGLMAYSVTKHAAVAVAEWLALTYGGPEHGVGFSCFCPQGVATPMLETWREEDPSAQVIDASGATISPEEAAEALVRGISENRFLILSHPEVQTYQQRKVGDPDRWLGGMQRLQVEIERAREGAG